MSYLSVASAVTPRLPGIFARIKDAQEADKSNGYREPKLLPMTARRESMGILLSSLSSLGLDKGLDALLKRKNVPATLKISRRLLGQNITNKYVEPFVQSTFMKAFRKPLLGQAVKKTEEVLAMQRKATLTRIGLMLIFPNILAEVGSRVLTGYSLNKVTHQSHPERNVTLKDVQWNDQTRQQMGHLVHQVVSQNASRGILAKDAQSIPAEQLGKLIENAIYRGDLAMPKAAAPSVIPARPTTHPWASDDYGIRSEAVRQSPFVALAAYHADGRPWTNVAR